MDRNTDYSKYRSTIQRLAGVFAFLSILSFASFLPVSFAGTTDSVDSTDARLLPPEETWNAVFLDLLEKLKDSPQGGWPEEETKKILALDYPTRASLGVGEIFSRLQQSSTSKIAAFDLEAFLKWLREKYGVLDRPLFTKMNPDQDGSYRIREKKTYSLSSPTLPLGFDPQEPSSLQNLEKYIQRKWGGLADFATPEHIIFSELGTHDTLDALSKQGYHDFFLINAPYAMRGSKALITRNPEGAFVLVFFSFVGRDLLNHKLMQLAIQYKESFSTIKVLSSNHLKSWEVAELVVAKSLAELPPIRIDDLVIGYSDRVEQLLQKSGTPLQTVRVGDFATLKYFSLTDANGMTRNIALLTNVELRYFGKSILTLVKPFLRRDLNRVIFAGSAGCLDQNIPLHSLIVPRVFHLLDHYSEAAPRRVELENDLFSLLPYGECHSGRHLSVCSPLVESQRLIRDLKISYEVLSIDVEGSQIAELISQHNQKHGTAIRFSAAFIVTDTPTASGETASTGYGLHAPQYAGKGKAKDLYVRALNFLWNTPGTPTSSHHTKIVIDFFSKKILSLIEQKDSVGLALLAADLERRLKIVNQHSAEDLRVSNGLANGYQNLLRMITNTGIFPIDPEYLDVQRLSVNLSPLDLVTQKIVLLQSLSRSSTLNLGKNQRKAVENAVLAIDEILNPSDRDADFGAEKILKLHATLNQGILDDRHLGKIRRFQYNTIAGKKTSSQQAFDDFARWYQSVPPSPMAALEAFLRLEHIHPFKDGNGRLAELLAQRLMIKATGHPLLFPNRFDIDYILALYRNGSFPGSIARTLDGLLEDSQTFSNWVKKYSPLTQEAEKIGYAPDTGLVTGFKEGRAIFSIRPSFRFHEPIALEKEERIIIDPTATVPMDALILQKSQYDVFFQLYPECEEALGESLAQQPKP